VEIDLERATDEDIVTVLQSIRSFTENTANIARVFEKYTVYSQELYPEKTGETWLDFFDKCIQRAAAMPDGALPAKLKEWVDETNKNPNELLRTLSKGHCKNWATELRRGAIFEAFDFAFFALHRVRTRSAKPFVDNLSNHAVVVLTCSSWLYCPHHSRNEQHPTG
jgi:hypothetical protein